MTSHIMTKKGARAPSSLILPGFCYMRWKTLRSGTFTLIEADLWDRYNLIGGILTTEGSFVVILHSEKEHFNPSWTWQWPVD